MITRQYDVTLFGETPLFMHADDIEWRDFIKEWQSNPDNKKKSVPGDDRTPAFTWIGFLYVDDGKVVIPSDNLMTCLREGGSKVPVGSGNKTFKRQTQAGILVDQLSWPVVVDGKEIPYDKIKPLIESDDYDEHKAAALSLGFELFAKPATVGRSKHIRVRPRFLNWACSGTITVLDETITDKVLREIWTRAGALCGLCDWRPSAPMSPGPNGRFTVELEKKR